MNLNRYNKFKEQHVNHQIKRTCLDRIIIARDSNFRAAQTFILVLFAVYSTFTSAYIAAFGFPGFGFEVMTNITEIVFAIDIVLRKYKMLIFLLEFFTEYISEEDFYAVRDIKKIGMRYIK